MALHINFVKFQHKNLRGRTAPEQVTIWWLNNVINTQDLLSFDVYFSHRQAAR